MRTLRTVEPILIYGSLVCWAYAIGAHKGFRPAWAMLAGELLLAAGLIVYFLRRHRA